MKVDFEYEGYQLHDDSPSIAHLPQFDSIIPTGLKMPISLKKTIKDNTNIFDLHF